MTVRTLAVMCCTGAILAGCGGRNATPLPSVGGNPLQSAAQAHTATVQTVTPGKPAPGKSTKASLTILVSIKRSAKPSPRYISPQTKGMTLVIKGSEKLRETLGLTHTSDPHCKDANGITTCTFTLQVSVGKCTANVAMFDQPPSSGHIPTSAKLLSIAKNVPFTVKSGKANRLKFKPAGIVASLAISSVPSGTAGTAFAAPQSFTVTAKDPDGFVIVGAYEHAVTLADSDTTGATTIATSGSDRPPASELLSSSDVATLTYTGFAIVPATLTASESGASSGTGTFTPTLQPIGPSTLAGGVPINTYQAASPLTFSASEAGWTNSPYNRTLSATLSSACSTFVTVTPASGTTFTPELIASAVNGACTLTLADGVGQQLVIPLGCELFSFTGSSQSTTIPSGLTEVTVDAVGASGGVGNTGDTNTPGLGEEVKATLSGLTSGETLYVYVGGAGGPGVFYVPYPGFNGGGPAIFSGAGGGASDVRTVNTQDTAGLSSRLLVAGGGGGAGGIDVGAPNGGNAGFANGANGAYVEFAALTGGGGGQKAPGVGGTVPAGVSNGGAGVDGQLGIGGGYSTVEPFADGGGGGGGYYGGGSGAGGLDASSHGVGGGGGGGSSFVESGATNVTSNQATTNQCDASNNGCITISW